MAASDGVILCRSPRVTVVQLRAWLDSEDRDHVAEFLRARFVERYLLPISSIEDSDGSSFAMMALCCLVVETLESFYSGWASSHRKSEGAFQQFFAREPEFATVAPHAHDFFLNVRCGILHQGETVGGWRIWKYGPLFNPATHCVNAKIFRRELGTALDRYTRSLTDKSVPPERWANCEAKLRAIIANC